MLVVTLLGFFQFAFHSSGIDFVVGIILVVSISFINVGRKTVLNGNFHNLKTICNCLFNSRKKSASLMKLHVEFFCFWWWTIEFAWLSECDNVDMKFHVSIKGMKLVQGFLICLALYYICDDQWNENRKYFLSWTVWCADPWLISRCAVISFTVTRWFSFTMSSTAALPSGVTPGCAWLDQGESVTELMPF